ncbi:hypothetical protein D0N87_30135, partial [Pseudomonas sp. ATCC 13867]
ADGNALDFSYNITSSNQLAPHHLLKRISASDGRTVSFSYSDESGTRATLSRISANGRYIDFDYVDANWGQGAKPHYLSAVKYPDGTRWT